MNIQDLQSNYLPTIQLRPDGIVCINYGHNPYSTAEGLLEIIERRRQLTPLPTPVLIKVTGKPVIDAQLPAVLRSAAYCDITLAVAYVSTSWHVKHLITTYLTVEKPPYPLFVFEDEDAAVACLRRYLPEPR